MLCICKGPGSHAIMVRWISLRFGSGSGVVLTGDLKTEGGPIQGGPINKDFLRTPRNP